MLNVKEVFKTYAGKNNEEGNDDAIRLCEKYPFLLHPSVVRALCQLPEFSLALLVEEPLFAHLDLPHGDKYCMLNSDLIALLTVLRHLHTESPPSVETSLQWRKEAFEAAANAPTFVRNSVYCAIITARLAQHVGPDEYKAVTKFNRDMLDKFYPFDPKLEPDVLLPNLEEFDKSLARVYRSEELARIIGCIRRQCGWESTQKIRNESAYFATAIAMLEAEGRVIALHNENPAYWISEVGGAPRWGWWCK